MTATPQRDMIAAEPGELGQERSRRRWVAIIIAFVAPLLAGGILMGGAIAARAPGDLVNDALYVGALAVCLWLVSRRTQDRRLLRLPAAAMAGGVAVGAARCGVWLLILPVARPGSALPVVAAVAGQVLLVAPAEEIQFRGIVLSRLLDSTRPWIAVALSAALFTALHAYSAALLVLPAVAADAVLFTALRARYRCLGGAVLAHAMFNVVTVVWPASAGVSTGTVAGYVTAVVVVDAVVAALVFRGAAPLGGTDGGTDAAGGASAGGGAP